MSAYTLLSKPRHIVGTGEEWWMGGAPCGRPSSPFDVDNGGRPSGFSLGEIPCGRPSGFSSGRTAI